MKILKNIKGLIFLLIMSFLLAPKAHANRKAILNIKEEKEYGMRYDSILEEGEYMFNVPREQLRVDYVTPYCEYTINLLPNDRPGNYVLDNYFLIKAQGEDTSVVCQSDIVYDQQQRNFNIQAKERNNFIQPIVETQLDRIFFFITPLIFFLGTIMMGVNFYYDKNGALRSGE